jgi:hypothetical protein
MAKAVAKPAPKAPAKRAAAPVKPAAKPVSKAAPGPAVKPAAKRAATEKKTVPKSAAAGLKNAAKALVKATRAAAPAAAAGRPALVRDSFTMPEGEYAVLAAVKQACLKAGVEVKKSELLRIGVALVGRLDLATLRQVLDTLPQLKTGRPPAS